MYKSSVPLESQINLKGRFNSSYKKAVINLLTFIKLSNNVKACTVVHCIVKMYKCDTASPVWIKQFLFIAIKSDFCDVNDVS